MTLKLSAIFFEYNGDSTGSPKFHGGPFGFGGYRQLAKPDPDQDLFDPAEDNINFLGHDYDDRPHMTPMEDESLRVENVVNDPGRILYRDLPGNKPNILVNPKQMIPIDQDPTREFPEEDHNRIKLFPDGKDDQKPDYWGIGPLEEPTENNTTLPKKRFEEVLGNPSANDWKSIEGNHMRGRDTRMVNTNILVAPRNWEEELPFKEKEQFNHLNDEDDVVVARPGSVSSALASPQKHIPDGKEQLRRLIEREVRKLVLK